MMHLIRTKISEGCAVCGADAYKACVPAADAVPPVQMELDLIGGATEIACLEYQIMGSVRRLRELKPEHTLVIVLAAVLRYQATEKPQHPQD
jgi:hypothetical protein